MDHKRLLICIGAQKAGTTWLADYLRDHPQVHTPPVKEVHYFDARYAPEWCAKYEQGMLDDLKREVERLTIENCADPGVQHKLHAILLRLRMIDSPQEYIRFMHWGAGERPVLFEATPDYSMVDARGFRAMKDMHPGAKLIFLLRNPADRFLSSLRFNKTYIKDFDIAGRWRELLAREDFDLLADYGRTIREALSVFDRGELHVGFYERLFEQPAIDRICDFAGIARRGADFSRRSNPSQQLGLPDDIREAALQRYRHVYRDIHDFMDGEIPESWRADMARLGA